MMKDLMTLQWTRNADIISIIIIIIVLLSLLKGMCEVLNLGVPAKMFLFCFASRAVNKTFFTRPRPGFLFQDQDQDFRNFPRPRPSLALPALSGG